MFTSTSTMSDKYSFAHKIRLLDNILLLTEIKLSINYPCPQSDPSPARGARSGAVRGHIKVVSALSCGLADGVSTADARVQPHDGISVDPGEPGGRAD